MKRIPIEFVVIGYHDHRIDKPAPFGFVLQAGPRISVYQRADLSRYNLPEIFEFTARNLGTVVLANVRKFDRQGEGLHQFLTRTCFNTVGSFRCWQPTEDQVPAGKLDDYIAKLKEGLNTEIAEYERALHVYDASCSPDWTRCPEADQTFTPVRIPVI